MSCCKPKLLFLALAILPLATACVTMNLDGSGTWNATCKTRAYLCSAFLGVSKSESYSCAPVAQ